ncbi:MAG: hypothetical protein ABL921_00135 [Pirellula sp.]
MINEDQAERIDHFELRSVIASLALLSVVFAVDVFCSSSARGQTPGGIEEFGRIESVDVEIENPSSDTELDKRLIDRVRSSLGMFPGDLFSRTTAEFNLARARRASQIAKTTIKLTPGPTGGVSITVLVTLGPAAAGDEGRGAFITRKLSDLPVLYDKDGTFVRIRLEGITMYYGNDNAWYGQPGPLLSGNPLVRSNPAGAGYNNWTEGFVHAGIAGITPLTDHVFTYGSFSSIYSGSIGQELFTDESRGYIGIEDAFVGIVGGETSTKGDRFIFNASGGRQRFGVGDGFLIANTASNGDNRGALQSNPRWAADTLVLGQAKYNNTKIETFYLDPDELPVVDSETVIAGVNFETRTPRGIDLGAMFLYVPASNFSYFTTSDVLSRKGLQVYDGRMRWQPKPAAAGPFMAGEVAIQRHDQIDMLALGWSTEIGYVFADKLRWSPTVSYRYASFSGDDVSSSRFERWDPLLSGDNGERWVQGINHFKIFQNSNLSTHRVQLRLRPDPKIELVPQLWFFSADETTNLGGNPAFSFLSGTYLGSETNMTLKWFFSPRVMLQAHVAATFPSSTAERTVGVDLDPWFSTMAFLRASF